MWGPIPVAVPVPGVARPCRTERGHEAARAIPPGGDTSPVPLSDAEWREAEPRESFVDIVYDVFADGDQAYSAEELFDELDDASMVEAFETALEVLVHEGALEKRLYPADEDPDDQVTYYRARDADAGVDRRFEE